MIRIRSRKLVMRISRRVMDHFDRGERLPSKVSKEINRLIQEELERMMSGFRVEKVELTPWERSRNITASEFLQI